ncbi:MAG: hypothetical protein A2498_00570 [Lentisphaerae bacterium RIFOXYC12_FULL_60_16]|nr:MAG: hypothetical protein A2498_00570 [Lentisphaerae bacterium RIFOXYC12_FULL_60_16]OGV74824.1 MAG: hypothetical protein A2269_03995 [Lentisphaerae bacterium RIFOXYA12_FULL_60_10]
MASIPSKDRNILRKLGEAVAAAAADPVNAVRREAHRRMDAHEKGRPTISIYQEPWNELNDKGELSLHCEDPFCRGIESSMRMTHYRWRHYPGDMTIAAESVQPLCFTDTGFGIDEIVDVARTDPENSVVSRHFHIQIKDESDIPKICMPEVTNHPDQTEECFRKRCEIFDGILSVRTEGVSSFWFPPWDQIVRWTGVQEILTDLIERPDYVHKVVGRLVDCWLHRLDQYEALGLLTAPPKELTVSGAAQIFSEVSPNMHREFALEHEARFFKRFGRTYYGCCEPLHNKVDICAECLPNLYKISMSPWVDFPKAVKNVGNRFIFAWKPNPAFLAHDHWNPDLVRNDIREKLTMAVEGGCFIEIHLKDISTVHHEPWRLTEWEHIAREEAERVFT